MARYLSPVTSRLIKGANHPVHLLIGLLLVPGDLRDEPDAGPDQLGGDLELLFRPVHAGVGFGMERQQMFYGSFKLSLSHPQTISDRFEADRLAGDRALVDGVGDL